MAMTDEAKETTINVAPNGNGWGPWGNGWGWGGPGWGGNGMGFFDNRAPATGVVGTVLGGVALLGLLGAGAGLLGRNGMGNNPNPPEFATVRDLANERLLSAKDAEIGKLQAQVYTDAQVNALRQELQATAATQGQFNATAISQIQALQGQTAQLMGMTTPVLKPMVITASEAVAAAAKPASASTGS